MALCTLAILQINAHDSSQLIVPHYTIGPANVSNVPPVALCWKPDHIKLVCISSVTIVCLTLAALWFLIVNGSDRFLGTQGEFSVLLVLLKLVACGVSATLGRHPLVVGSALLFCSVVLTVFNVKFQPVVDPTHDGERANSIRSGVYTGCTVTGGFGLLSYSVEDDNSLTITIVYCITVVASSSFMYLLNMEHRADPARKDRSGQLQEDLRAVISSSTAVDALGGVFREGLFGNKEEAFEFVGGCDSDWTFVHWAFEYRNDKPHLRLLALAQLEMQWARGELNTESASFRNQTLTDAQVVALSLALRGNIVIKSLKFGTC
jgi:hypothetical protein